MMIVTVCLYYRCKHYVTEVYNLMNLLTELMGTAQNGLTMSVAAIALYAFFFAKI